MLVPLRLRYGCAAVAGVPHSRAAGRVTNSVLPTSASDSVPTPGATRSGFWTRSIRLGPSELNAATESSRRSAVPLWLAAPTVSTHGAFPGDVMPPNWGCPRVVPAKVAGGRDDDDAGVDRAPGRERQRVGPVGLVHAGRDRQIDDPDVVDGALLDRVVDRRDRAADEPVAELVERPQHDQVRARGDAPPGAVRVVAAAGDDPGDVRAVTVAVVRLRLEIDEVDELHDPVAAQVVVRRG